MLHPEALCRSVARLKVRLLSGGRSWKQEHVRREELERIGEQLGVKARDDWYSVSQKDAVSKFPQLKSILVYHGDGLTQALADLIPEHSWSPVKFSRKPRRFWNNLANLRASIDEAASQLKAETKAEWYKFSLAELKAARPEISSALAGKSCKSLFELLELVYPDHSWQPEKVRKTRHSGFTELRIFDPSLLDTSQSLSGLRVVPNLQRERSLPSPPGSEANNSH